MQMQKKITLKEDGRFLVYYHFPDTATPEETQAFEAVQEEKSAEGGRPPVDTREGAAGAAASASDSSLIVQHSSLNPEGSAHV